MVQMEMTAAHLAERPGITVVTSDTEHTPELAGVDVVHGYGLSAEQIHDVRRKEIPVVLSVIYVSRDYLVGNLDPRPSRRERIRHSARRFAVLSVAALRGRLQQKRAAYNSWWYETVRRFQSADMLLPNSYMEACQIRADADVTTPMVVVPNAVDPAVFTDDNVGDREGVLYVGRIEPHKNQLRLIEALRGTGLKLTIVGADHPHHPRYCAAVRRAAAAEPSVEMVGPVPHSLLADHYRRARVHAVPSLFETTGLVSLEAALCGCSVVSTNQGYAREYLLDMAEYCDPYDLDSIRGAILRSFESIVDGRLRQRVLDNYTWAHTAEATERAYRKVLEGRGRTLT